MRNSQLSQSTQDESCYKLLQGARVSNHPAICTKSARCCVIACWHKLKRTTTEILSFSDTNRIFFNGKDIWWCLSQEIPRIIHRTDPEHHLMMYGSQCYSQCGDDQNQDLALFKSIKCTNRKIQDAACLYAVHLVPHLTSHPPTKSTQTTMVNALIKNLAPLPGGKYGDSGMHSTWRRHQAIEVKSGCDAQRVGVLGALCS